MIFISLDVNYTQSTQHYEKVVLQGFFKDLKGHTINYA